MVGGLGGHLSSSGTRPACEREIAEINAKAREIFMVGRMKYLADCSI